MFSDSVMISMIFETILSAASIVIPLAWLWFVSRKKEEGMIGSFALGVLAFFWAQILIPLPIVGVFDGMSWFDGLIQSKSFNYVYVIIIVQMIYAAFGVVGRVWCIWLMNRRTPSLYRAMSSAVGIAAFNGLSKIIQGINSYNDMKFINAKGEEAFKNMLLADTTMSVEDVSAKLDGLKAIASYDGIIFGMNVIFSVLVELALIIILYQGFIQKKTVKASVVCAIVSFLYAFAGNFIDNLGNEIMGGILSRSTATILLNVYMFACALASVWLISNALGKYKKAMAEGAYAQVAYFEKKDK